MLDVIASINSAVNNVVWGWPALILLAFVGILMTTFGKIPLRLLKLLVNLMLGVEFAKDSGVKDDHLRLAVIARNKNRIGIADAHPAHTLGVLEFRHCHSKGHGNK